MREHGSSGKNTPDSGPDPDSYTCSGVGVPARGEEIVSTILTEGNCGELRLRFLHFVAKGSPGKLIMENNAEIPVNAV